VVFTGIVWFNFTYFREQTCLIVCPYGRWQSALIDRQSVIVAYDYVRGEPRAHATKDRDPKAGDCIDCSACVQTCPTGIDIRNGLQMECVHCTQCIDACDDVMVKVGKPKGLIRYSSQDAIAGQPRKLLRLRTILYPVVLAILLSGLGWAMVTKAPADITIMRGLEAPFTVEADGRISNQIRIKITNRRGDEQQYAFTVEGLADEKLQSKDITIVAPENPMTVSSQGSHSTSMFILLPRTAFEHGERYITLSVRDSKGYTEQIKYRLLGPSSESEK
jgi:cytochrome c oxidase accessory protein FixG